MKKILSILCCITISMTLLAAEVNMLPSKFDVVVSFGSRASGPSSDAFLRSFIKRFSKKYAVKLPAYKAAACGREGEFNILFSTTNVKSAVKKRFLSELNTAVAAEQKKNKAKDENSGDIAIDHNKSKSDFDFCREGIKPWK